ncbi:MULTISPECIES: SPOR domain-containing protein [Rhodonellum]|nr:MULTISPECIES: SPOR domain-containing protein [Rhodonellum]SDZ50534.1 Sporulation related domain-containing protein [Rhodonellum ikkaensis]
MDSENKERAKGKDYGFPFVEVVPVRPILDEPTLEAMVPIAEISTEEANPIEIKRPEKVISRPMVSFEKKKKKSQTPVLLFLILFMVILMMAMAYFLYFLPDQQERETPFITEEIVVVEEPSILLEEEDVKDEEFDMAPALEVLDTPVEEIKAGEIILITEKGQRPSFHIIAGSLPNERLAREEAQKLLAKGATVWLISPTGDTRNYRISVGKYDYFQSATEALEKAKMEFDESIWILKY